MDRDKKIELLESLNCQLDEENKKLQKQLEEVNEKLIEVKSQTNELIDSLSFSKKEYESLIVELKGMITDFNVHSEIYKKLKK